MALSSDGSMVAWSTEPASGDGVIDIYAGPLTAPARVFEQSSTTCPCFRVFAFMNDPAKHSNSTLLLTDDQQSHEAIQFGLWTLDLTAPLSATPRPLLDGNSPQGPLALSPYGNVLSILLMRARYLHQLMAVCPMIWPYSNMRIA